MPRRLEIASSCSVLTHHFAVLTELLVHFVDCHDVRLCGDVHDYIRLFTLIVHRTVGFVGCNARVGIEIASKATDSVIAEDAEDVTLVIVEF